MWRHVEGRSGSSSSSGTALSCSRWLLGLSIRLKTSLMREGPRSRVKEVSEPEKERESKSQPEPEAGGERTGRSDREPREVSGEQVEEAPCC